MDSLDLYAGGYLCCTNGISSTHMYNKSDYYDKSKCTISNVGIIRESEIGRAASQRGDSDAGDQDNASDAGACILNQCKGLTAEERSLKGRSNKTNHLRACREQWGVSMAIRTMHGCLLCRLWFGDKVQLMECVIVCERDQVGSFNLNM